MLFIQLLITCLNRYCMLFGVENRSRSAYLCEIFSEDCALLPTRKCVFYILLCIFRVIFRRGGFSVSYSSPVYY
uniref:Putative secreted protein n=1 Tax=Anopheles triannulatus TaxID=58253 RepID=A0A2M4B2P5_9DIPT